MKEKEVRKLVASIWPVKNSQAVIYDGQFDAPEYSLSKAKRVIRVVLQSAELHYSDRYAFQEEVKAFASLLTNVTPNKLHLRLLRKLCKWYPRDRYFAYLLAIAYASHRKYIRGILALYRVLKDWDFRDVLYGSWIEINIRLLLTRLYQLIDKESKRYWKRYKYIEKEFKLATLAADSDISDHEPIGFGEWKRLDGTPISTEEKDFLKNVHKEFGFDIPQTLSVDKKYLRAMVHHEYSEYLLGELHREREALHHEEIVTKLIPEYGEAYLNCARGYLGIGDTQRAISFAKQGSIVTPKYMDSVTYEYWLSMVKWKSYQDMGEISLAQESFSRCHQLVRKEPLCNDTELRGNIEALANETTHWEQATHLASLRQKVFGEQLSYAVPSLNIKINLPGDWKIDRELFLGDVFTVTFAPEVTWNEDAQCPNDASVSILYSSQQQIMALDIETFGTKFLKFPAGKPTWNLCERLQTFGDIKLCGWRFSFSGSWAKEGILMAFASPTFKAQIHVMCQSCGKDIFWPVLTSVVETFAQNFLQKSDWKLRI